MYKYKLFETGCGKWVHIIDDKAEFRSNRENATIFNVEIEEIFRRFKLGYLEETLERHDEAF